MIAVVILLIVAFYAISKKQAEKRQRKAIEEQRKKEQEQRERDRAMRQKLREIAQRQAAEMKAREAIRKEQERLAREQERQAKEQERQAAQLAKHEKRIADLEYKVRKLDRDIESQNELLADYYAQLDWLLLQQSGTVTGGKEFAAWQNKIVTKNNQIRKAENKIADMKDAKAMAQRELAA